MSRDLVLDVIARKNSRDLSTLADEFDRLARKTDDAGKKMHQTGTFSQFLEDQIAKTKIQVQQLGEEIDRTGNKDLYAKLRGAQANLKSLERIKTDLSKALGDGGDEGGKASALRFVKSFASVVKDPAAAGGIGVAGLAVGAVAGAAINGALLAGIAGGGIALGIVGQAKNPAVRAAWADTGQFISGELTRATSGFEKPLENAAHIIRDDIGQAIDQIHFDRVAQSVEPLARGFGGLVDHTIPGLNAALDQGAGILDDFSAQLPSVGDALSDMFRKFSQGSTGAKEGLRTLVMMVNFLARATGDLELGLSKTYEWLVNVGVKTSWWSDAIGHNVPVIGTATSAIHDFFEALKQGGEGEEILVHKGETLAEALKRTQAEAAATGNGMDKLMQQVNATASSFDTVAGAIASKVLNEMMSLDQATLAVAESQTRLTESVKENGRSLDIHTAKGQANREALLAGVAANAQMYQAMISAGISATDAASQYDANTNALYAGADAAHMNMKEVDGLIGKYRGVPGKVDTDIAARGLTTVLGDLGGLLAKLNGLDGRQYGFTIRETHVYENDYIDTRRGERANAHGGAIRAYAGGGNVFSVGEMGKELLTLPPLSAPAYVTPNSALNGAANRGAGNDVIGTLRVVHERPNGTVIREELVALGRQRNYRTVDQLLPVAGVT